MVKFRNELGIQIVWVIANNNIIGLLRIYLGGCVLFLHLEISQGLLQSFHAWIIWRQLLHLFLQLLDIFFSPNWKFEL